MKEFTSKTLEEMYFSRNGEIAFRLWMFAIALACLESMPNLAKVNALLAKVVAFGSSDLFKTQATDEEKSDLEHIRKALLAIHDDKPTATMSFIVAVLKEIRYPEIPKFKTIYELRPINFARDLHMRQEDFQQLLYELGWHLRNQQIHGAELQVDQTIGQLAEWIDANLRSKE